MKRVAIWALGAVAALAAVVLLVAGVIVARLHAPPPALTGEAVVAGASGPIEIIRDRHGVPHIFAASEADLYRGLGFVHAQDRLFQMDATRRYMQGRLAELIGARGLKSDARARIMGWGAIAQAQLDRLSPDAQALLAAYTDGVNAQIAKGPAPPEYALFFAGPEPWRPVDSLAVSLAMTDLLTGGEGIERARARLAARLTPQQIDEFLVGYPDWAPRSYASGDLAASRAPRAAQGLETDGGGSNAWVVSGARTGTGKPVLANDPHLPLAAPGPFYLARLQGEGITLIGASLPGAPNIVIGRTERLAWGTTTHQIDAADEAPLAADAAVESRTEAIRVRVFGLFHRTERITARRAAEGPVLEPEWFPEAAAAHGGPTVLRTIADDADNGVANALFAATKAETVDGFIAALAPWTAPPQNLVVADAAGGIGLVSPGRFPIRDAEGRWTGEIAGQIAATNPASGFFATANNLQTPADFPYPMPGGHDAYRVARIAEVLAADPAHDAARAAALQRDRRSVLALRVKPALAAATPSSEPGRAMQARLAAWDGEADPAAIEPTLFGYWKRAMGEALYGDELGDLFAEYRGPRDAFLDAALTGTTLARWCDDVATAAEVETCPAIVGRALDRAAERLAAERGADPAGWAWGEIHAARFPNAVLSGLPFLGPAATVSVPFGGDSTTVNVARNWHDREDYATVHAAGLRMVVDFADLQASRFVIAPGQSGHWRSPHYGDLASLWAEGGGFEIRSDWGPEAAPEGARRLSLRPAR